MKKIAFAMAIMLLISLQGYLIYALEHGAAQQFEAMWQSFGVEQTRYSAFVFRSLSLWWSAPALCALAAGYALWRGGRAVAVLALGIGLAGPAALLWAMYAPALMITL